MELSELPEEFIAFIRGMGQNDKNIVNNDDALSIPLNDEEIALFTQAIDLCDRHYREYCNPLLFGIPPSDFIPPKDRK